MALLSKSDFKVARNCPTKLFYKKSGYPSVDAENPYLELLAEGGFMVEKMVKLLFPGGREMDFGGPSELAGSETMQALRQDILMSSMLNVRFYKPNAPMFNSTASAPFPQYSWPKPLVAVGKSNRVERANMKNLLRLPGLLNRCLGFSASPLKGFSLTHHLQTTLTF